MGISYQFPSVSNTTPPHHHHHHHASNKQSCQQVTSKSVAPVTQSQLWNVHQYHIILPEWEQHVLLSASVCLWHWHVNRCNRCVLAWLHTDKQLCRITARLVHERGNLPALRVRGYQREISHMVEIFFIFGGWAAAFQSGLSTEFALMADADGTSATMNSP